MGKEVFLSKALKYEGQILGCNVSSAIALKDKVDAFLIIGSGRFHAYNVASLGKPVFIWHPGSNVVEFPREEMLKINARKKANLIKFLSTDSIGIIVSSKPGQCRLSDAMEFRRKLEKKGKRVFVFISDMISANDLENFKVGIWINTACPQLILDMPNVLNIDEAIDVLK
jgi:2-(3-amino-3-carboxypropyl)histidine synthase